MVALAARSTCSSMGRPPTAWVTLGKRDFIRVPLPAARMTAAKRLIRANNNSLRYDDQRATTGSGARIRTWDRGSKVHCLTTWPRRNDAPHNVRVLSLQALCAVPRVHCSECRERCLWQAQWGRRHQRQYTIRGAVWDKRWRVAPPARFPFSSRPTGYTRSRRRAHAEAVTWPRRDGGRAVLDGFCVVAEVLADAGLRGARNPILTNGGARHWPGGALRERAAAAGDYDQSTNRP